MTNWLQDMFSMVKSSSLQAKPTMDQLPKFIEQIENHSSETEFRSAINSIYTLGDVNHKGNRIQMLHGFPRLLPALIRCLLETSHAQIRKFVLLALNNLTIPPENKTIMANNHDLLRAFVRVISNNDHDSYMACICLTNLSSSEELTEVLLKWSPDATDMPLSQHQPILRVLESVLESHVSSPSLYGTGDFLKSTTEQTRLLSQQTSTQPTTKPAKQDPSMLRVTYAIGAIRNFCKCQYGAQQVAQTSVPSNLVKILHPDDTDKSPWKNNGKEDMALIALMHYAQWEYPILGATTTILQSLLTTFSPDSLEYLKATLTCALLGDGNLPESSANVLVELMYNVAHQQGKKDLYALESFPLPLVVKAYHNAVVADKEFCRRGNVWACPMAIASCLDMVEEFVKSTGKERLSPACAFLIVAAMETIVPQLGRNESGAQDMVDIVDILEQYAVLTDDARATKAILASGSKSFWLEVDRIRKGGAIENAPSESTIPRIV